MYHDRIKEDESSGMGIKMLLIPFVVAAIMCMATFIVGKVSPSSHFPITTCINPDVILAHYIHTEGALLLFYHSRIFSARNAVHFPRQSTGQYPWIGIQVSTLRVTNRHAGFDAMIRPQQNR